MKKIVILTAGYGGGHNAAAQALARGLELEGVAADRVKVVDLLQSRGGKVNAVIQKAYLAAAHRLPLVWGKIYRAIDSHQAIEARIAAFPPLRRAMAALLEHEQPDVVVSTFPVYNTLIASLYRETPRRPFRQVTVVTDSLSVNAIWYRGGSDLFFVPNEETARVLEAAGVSAGQVCALGFPVAPYFAEAAGVEKLPPAPGAPWRILYALQPWQTDAVETVQQLLCRSDIELTLTVAGNDRLHARLEALVVGAGRGEVHGRTPRMPEFIARSHLLIGKAGGAMVHEALAGRTPMLITQVIPGQEEGNARLLSEAGCGAVAKDKAGIVSTVERLFAEGGAIWLEWHRQLLRLSYPNAAREVARSILHLTS